MKRSLFTAMLLLMGVLSLPVASLSAAQAKIDPSSLIAKDDELHHKKWFLRYTLERPVGVNLGGNPALFGHFQVAIRDPQGELIFHRTYSFETLPPVASPALVQTIKISKPIKGKYTLFVTLLDRNSDSGVFDPNAIGLPAGKASNYLLKADLFNDKNQQIDLTPSDNTIIAPPADEITKPTDPSHTIETFFNLHLP